MVSNTMIFLPGCCASFVLICLIIHSLKPRHDPAEPPLIPPHVSIIGHIVGLLREGTGYYTKIARECQKPIFTLDLIKGKLYVVTSPRLVAACDRRAKTVSFVPYVIEFARRIMAWTPAGLDLVAKDVLEENSTPILRTGTMRAIHQLLQPGPSLDKTAATIVSSVLESLLRNEQLDDSNTDGVPLFRWLRNSLSVATTNGIYGSEHNPFQDPEVLDGFWAVEKNFALLGLMIYPDIIAPHGSHGGRRFFSGVQKYYASGAYKNASDLVKTRYRISTKYDLPESDIVGYDIGLCTAFLVNTIPAIGWTLCHVFSKPELLAELRRGIEAVVFPDGEPDPKQATNTTVNIAQVTKAFPFLDSFIREVLRVQSNNASARAVLKDTLISDGAGSTYLLKKGAMLVMPSASIHADTDVWGPTSQQFDPTRFLNMDKGKILASSWRTFGGGNSLCPGRFLAMHEIASILVVMVLKYNIRPCTEDGAWRIPATRNHISTSIFDTS
ncbi:cytochrome P450 [Rhypophila sp. PSN 637]